MIHLFTESNATYFPWFDQNTSNFNLDDSDDPDSMQVSNTSSNRQCSDESRPQKWAIYTGAVVTGSISIIGMVMNLLAMTLMVHQFVHKSNGVGYSVTRVTPDKVLMFNLIIIDFLYCSVAMPFLFSTYVLSGEPIGCSAGGFIRYSLNFAEVNTLSITALARCYGVLGTSKRTLFTFSQAIMCSIFIDLTAILFQVYFTFTLRFGFNACMFRCDYMLMGIARSSVFVIEGILPAIVLVISYMQVIVFLVRHRRRNPVTCSSQEQQKVSRQTGRAVKSLLQHMYVVTCLPASLYNILDTYGQHKEIGILCYCPFWFLFIINPMTFLIYDKRAQKTLKNLCWMFNDRRDNAAYSQSAVAHISNREGNGSSCL